MAQGMQNRDKRMDELEKQVGQIADFMGQFREQGKLPSSTVVNPRGGVETANAITLRSGKEVGTEPKPSKSALKEDEKLQIEEEEQAKATARIEQSLPQPPKPSNSANKGRLPSSTVVNPKGGFESAKAMHLRSGKQVGSDLKPSKSRSNEEEELRIEEEEEKQLTAEVEPTLPQATSDPNSSNSSNKGKNVSSSVPTNNFPVNVPFPSRFKQTKKEEAEKDILETFRKVQVNIPLLDAIKQVPRYAKFLKELCTNRRRISTKEVVKVGENVSAILQRKLPPKCKDPGSFTIPCVIGNSRFESVMLDLGASINVMPYSIYASMNLGALKNDGVIIQLADRSNAYPKGVLEDVLVQDHLDNLMDDALELVIARGMDKQNVEASTMETHGMHITSLAVPPSDEVIEMVAALESLPSQSGKYSDPILSSVSANKMLPSVVQPPTLELKPLPSHLKYVFLGEDDTLPVIISSSLTA
ncbi:uncharacterized protein [Malus domestica]|uniref:uncharacterized protein n=1 Tax=Malus domestica TaxID=3750 RepID=UPI003974F824